MTRRPLYKIAVMGIVIREDTNQVLLEKRPDHDYFRPGQWALPGGGLELDDGSAAKGCQREICEETGLDLRDWTYIGDEIITASSGHPLYAILFATEVTEATATCVRDVEGTKAGLGWFYYKQLPELLRPERVEFVKRAFQKLRVGVRNV